MGARCPRMTGSSRANKIDRVSAPARPVEPNGGNADARLSSDDEAFLIRNDAVLPKMSRIRKGDIKSSYIFESKVLGTGFSGPVKLATHKTSGQEYAVKPFKKSGANRDRLALLRNEAEIYLSLDHPHIARLIEIWEDQDAVYIVMELCSGEELYTRLCASKIYTEKAAADVTSQMLEAIAYLHCHNVVHRDLKLENWLYENATPAAALKLIDFGFSKMWDGKVHRKMQATCGSLAYVSPDTLSGSYTNACDMWSLGVIVYMLLVGYPPFYGSENEVLSHIIAGKYALTGSRWPTISPMAKDFVRRLLEVNPSRRLTAREALGHPWIRDRVKSPEVDIAPDVLLSLRTYAQSSNLKRATLSMMAYFLKASDTENLRDLFKTLDRSGEGTIRLDELAAALKENTDISNEEIERIFASLDHNKDEQIYYTDFLGAMLGYRIKVNRSLIRNAFDRFDCDGSGYITTENLRSMLGTGYDGATVDELIREADRDGDGRIDFEEFLAAVTNGAEMENEPTLGKSLDTEKLLMVNRVIDRSTQPRPFDGTEEV